MLSDTDIVTNVKLTIDCFPRQKIPQYLVNFHSFPRQQTANCPTFSDNWSPCYHARYTQHLTDDKYCISGQVQASGALEN